MISYVQGNLFESPAQTLVNTVNTVGAMGKGIALQFKHYFPAMFEEYHQLCAQGKLQIGTLHIYQTPHKKILNFPTKQDWRRPSELGYIEAGLDTFVRMYQDAGIQSVAFPPLGCGNGELNYADVRPLMESYLRPLPIPVYLYPPLPRTAAVREGRPSTHVPEHRTQAAVREWLHTEPRMLPFPEVWRDILDVLARHRAFVTLRKQTPFEAEYVPSIGNDPEALRFRSAGKVFLVERKELLSVWRDLSAHGIATSMSLDSRHAPFVFPVMARLPYLGVVETAESFDRFEFHNRMHALQLVPSSGWTVQRSLALSG